MAEKKKIIIVCGETSGDTHAGQLAGNIIKLNPEVEILAVGGHHLKESGATLFYDIKELSVLGFFDVIKKLPLFFRLRTIILERIKLFKPDLIILVDFSGFNLRLAKAINKQIPVIYYISPQVWASREGRVKTIKEYISKMIVFFKFEEEFYRKHGFIVDFVGHPLLDFVAPTMSKNEFLSGNRLSTSKTTIALLPGSRENEIKRILPVMLKTAKLLSKKIKEIQFIIAKPPGLDWEVYNKELKNIDLDIKIIEDKTYDCLNSADFCLVASGTATLETAILQKPCAVIYKMGLLNYLLYRPQVKVAFISLVNILSKKEIIPEFVQFKALPQKISEEALKILLDPAESTRMKNDLSQIRSLLGEKGASLRAAQIVVDFLNKSHQDTTSPVTG